MDARLKILLRSLKCPICLSQIDYMGVKMFNSFNDTFCCSNNYEHYVIKINNINGEYCVVHEVLTTYDNGLKFRIAQYKFPDDSKKVYILVVNVDKEHNVIENHSEKDFRANYILDLQSLSEKQIIEQVEMLLLFQ